VSIFDIFECVQGSKLPGTWNLCVVIIMMTVFNNKLTSISNQRSEWASWQMSVSTTAEMRRSQPFVPPQLTSLSSKSAVSPTKKHTAEPKPKPKPKPHQIAAHSVGGHGYKKVDQERREADNPDQPIQNAISRSILQQYYSNQVSRPRMSVGVILPWWGRRRCRPPRACVAERSRAKK